jgi:hypothetical protein
MNAQEMKIIEDAASILSDGMLADEVGPQLTCSEAETLARFISLMRGEPEAQAFLKAHAQSDDEDDDHFDL